MELGILYAFMFALYLFFLLELINRKAMAKDVACMHDMMHQALHVVLGDQDDITVEEIVEKSSHEEIQAWDEGWILESNKQNLRRKPMTNAPPLVHIHLQRQAKGDSSNLLFLCTNGGA